MTTRPLKTRDARDTIDRLRAYVWLGPPALFLLIAGEWMAGVLSPVLILLDIGLVVLVAELIHKTALGSGKLFARIVLAGGNTGTASDYSYQESLIVRGRYDEADRSYAELCAAAPDDPEARIRRAELHERHLEDRHKAERFYLEARRIGLPRDRDLYVSHCLADIYRESGRTDRLKFELARLVDQFAGTRPAAAAKVELARLKNQEAQR